MIKSKIMLCAKGVIRDTDTNNITVYSIIENINAIEFPVIFPEITILNIFEKSTSDEDLAEEKLILKQGKQILFEKKFKINFQKKKRLRMIIYLQNIAIQRPGVLNFICYINNKKVDNYTIDIDFKKKTKTKVKK